MAHIDVIIPVYNCKTYLSTTVKTVLSQPYKDINIWLIDDGSTDGSAELCDAIVRNSDGKVNVIHQKNQGVSHARNVGIESVLAEDDAAGWIAFLDADDYWMDNTLQKSVVEVFDSKNCDLIVMESVMCDESGSVFKKPILHDSRICDGGDAIIWKFPMHFGSILYRKKLLKTRNIRFIEGLKYSEDTIFLQQSAALSSKVYFVDILLYVYRKNRNSAIHFSVKIAAIKYYLPIINGWIQSDDFINRSLGRSDYDAGKTLASIYFLDMIAEHCMQHRKMKEVQQICYNHPRYDLFINMQPENVNKKQYKEHNHLLKHPLLFAIKYNIIGAVKASIRKLAYSDLVYKWYIKRRFPYKLTDLK